MMKRCIALISVCLLTSCAGGDEGPAPSNVPVPSANGGIPAAPQPATDWDPTKWTPEVTVKLPTLTEEERLTARDEHLAQMKPEGMAPPEVELIRWTEGSADYINAQADCLTEAGFKAVPSLDGQGTEFPEGIPAEQDAAFQLAAYICEAQYTPDPRQTTDWNEDQLKVVYDYWTQYFIPCMKAHGHPVSTDDAPSREVYVATFYEKDVERWWPQEALNSLPEEEAAGIVKECPGLPPDHALYGG